MTTMLTRTTAGLLRTAGSPTKTAISCLFGQHHASRRAFSVSYRRPADDDKSKTPADQDALAKSISGLQRTVHGPGPNSPLANAPRSYGKKTTEFTPTPLARPIGLNYRPEAGQNSGIDNRSLQQRRDDFVDYDKHLIRRRYLTFQMAKPYFRDWRNLQFHKGKTFLSPPRLFKSDLSLYFPNLHGRTLAKTPEAAAADTTPVLEGHASVVTLFSGRWAEKQIKTFVSPESNPDLHQVLKASDGKAQLVQINVEEGWSRFWLLRLFTGTLRKKVGKENWGKYFIIHKGISDEIRESIGLLNSKVGYTYLVGHDCRIRWAGSGDAEPGEPESLVKGLRRLLEEMKQDGVGANYTMRPVVKKLTEEKK